VQGFTAMNHNAGARFDVFHVIGVIVQHPINIALVPFAGQTLDHIENMRICKHGSPLKKFDGH